MSSSPKTALVTGASAGLGHHITRLLAERGYQVTITGRDAEKLDATMKQLAPGLPHRLIALDLSVRSDMQELVRLIEQQRFDVLVNNAGASHFGSLASLKLETVEQDLWLNFMTPACLSWAFVKAAKPGSVLVNVTSIVGIVPVPGNALYCAAKAGVQTLSECLWYEAKDKQVRVIDFRPVSLRTGFHQAAGGKSMSTAGMAVEPGTAARDLVDAIANRKEFVYSYGAAATLLDWARRVIPRRLLIHMMGVRSRDYLRG